MTGHHHECGHQLPEGVGSQASELYAAFKRVMQLNRQLMSRATTKIGSHPAQIGCLMVLAHHENVTQRDLAGHLHIAPATLTTMLQRMERDGLIERRADAADQRVTRVTLTDSGRERAAELGAIHADTIRTLLGGLSEADQRELIRLLTLIGDNVSKELGR